MKPPVNVKYLPASNSVKNKLVMIIPLFEFDEIT